MRVVVSNGLFIAEKRGLCKDSLIPDLVYLNVGAPVKPAGSGEWKFHTVKI